MNDFLDLEKYFGRFYTIKNQMKCKNKVLRAIQVF